MQAQRVIKISWQPQPRQLKFLQAAGLSLPFDGRPLVEAAADIIGYGGAAGGGKTDCNLAAAIVAAISYPRINIGYFRREYPTLEGPGGAIMRSRELIGHFAKYNEQKKRWTFPNGSIIQFCHCKDPGDVYNYQSQQFDILIIDEVTQFTKEMVKYLLTRNRATVNFPTFKPFAIFSTNPGNIGHSYFKDEFVTLGPAEQVNIFVNESGDEERHLFIPSKLSDNQILEARDPGYRKRLGSTELNRRVLLEGDWDVFAGQAFAELSRDVHLVTPFTIPPHWLRFAAYDYGFNHPFSFGVFVVSDDGEVYLVNRASGRFLKPYQQAQLMVKACGIIGGITTLRYIEAGHDCWNPGRDGGPTMAENFSKLPETHPDLKLPKINLKQANIARVAGSVQLREYISYKDKLIDDKGNPLDGKPMFYIFNTAECTPVYDCLARMIFDTDGPKPEDVKKVDADENGYGGDDDYDMTRYALMSRPKAATKATQPKPPQNSVLGHVQKMQEQRWAMENYIGYSN